MPSTRRCRAVAIVDTDTDDEEHPRQRLRTAGNSEPSNSQDNDVTDNNDNIADNVRPRRQRLEVRRANLTREEEEDWENECLWAARLGFLFSRYAKPHQI